MALQRSILGSPIAYADLFFQFSYYNSDINLPILLSNNSSVMKHHADFYYLAYWIDSSCWEAEAKWTKWVMVVVVLGKV
jgi:hypothetical protein